MRRHRSVAFTLVELLVVVVILAGLIAMLLPMLSKARESAAHKSLSKQVPVVQHGYLDQFGNPPSAAAPPAEEMQPAPARQLAALASFDADVTLTPRLSVGTDQPESIYEARFVATLQTQPPRDPVRQDARTAIELPLPPEIISLADLAVTFDGQPVEAEAISVEGDKLVWAGVPPTEKPAQVGVTYTAVGRGLYSLQTPPGRIIDHFKITLTAAGSDVRMLDLSMQPTSLDRQNGQTVYVWDYNQLMFGRPIAVDVLGIAPIDRLGELSWLGPLSLAAFGLIVGLVAHAFGATTFDRYMLLLVLGTFAGAYPLMYFAQEFIPLYWAIGLAAGVMLVVVTWRVVSIMGVKIGFVGVTLPGVLIMAVAITAALKPSLQGILLTGLALLLFVAAMSLAPKIEPKGPPVIPA